MAEASAQPMAQRRCPSLFMTGVRILPGTALARQAVAEGRLAPWRDLAEPAFHFTPEARKRGWTPRRATPAS